MSDYRDFLRPDVVSRLSRLDIVARLVVEGFITGLHRSPYHGFSVEFAEYRPYMPGDSTKDVDWKVYGKTDRLYVKEHEEETNLKAYVLLDGRFAVAEEDLRALAPAVMRHRIVVNFRAEAEGIDADAVVTDVLDKTRA